MYKGDNMITTADMQKITNRNEWLDYILESIARNLGIQLEYKDSGIRNVDPYGLKPSADKTDLLLQCIKNTGEVRTYLLDNILALYVDEDITDEELMDLDIDSLIKGFQEDKPEPDMNMPYDISELDNSPEENLDGLFEDETFDEQDNENISSDDEEEEPEIVDFDLDEEPEPEEHSEEEELPEIISDETEESEETIE